jgi:biopolymer transport protein TolQ
MAEQSLSTLELFYNADWVVRYVVIVLFSASIFSWSIAFHKWIVFRTASKKNRAFIVSFQKNTNFDIFSNEYNSLADSEAKKLFAAMLNEWQASTHKAPAQRRYLVERIQIQLSMSLRETAIRWEKYLSILATIGSSAPFIGLLGTVWGIMNSFRAIAITQQSSLAVVAPGIAEALFATALGLFAAIPASIFYNFFTASLKKQVTVLEVFADDIEVRLSRHFDQAAR